MRTKKVRSVAEPEAGESVEAWAGRIAALEPDVAQGVIAYAVRIAGNRRVPKEDREIAQAQADALKRAVSKAKRNPKKIVTTT